ncbi:TetR/AcrR family transcriptional regulator [Gorillibacterium sp. CAU 1737]|uniref:TetR/AcrR family transcriptional regulator n=1 Tax=Gorillibacterium sp. CAU 1737 TaxID=3140362 RepID=UPI003261B107
MTGSQRQKQKQATRQNIIAMALQQYGENGFLKTRTADIAHASKVSHGTIFAHFPTQEELIVSVIEEFGNRISARLHELTYNTSGIVDLLSAHIQGLLEYEAFYTRLVIEGRLLPKDARNTFILIQSTISFYLGQVAEREMEEGKIATLPIHMIFNSWTGLLHYYLINSDLFAPGESVLLRYGDEILNFYMELLAPKNID